jgi:hypothetical protein
MPSVQGIYYYFYAFYRWHNHISFKVMLHSGIPKCKTSYLLWLFHSFAVTLQAVSKMEAKGVLYQLIRLRLYPQNLIRVMPTQG